VQLEEDGSIINPHGAANGALCTAGFAYLLRLAERKVGAVERARSH
jgi:hypothetical protein